MYTPTWYERILWPIQDWYRNKRFRVKMALQRVFRGFDDTYWREHHSVHAEMTANALRLLASKKEGCPSAIWDSTGGADPCHQWKSILLTIAEGFEAAVAIEQLDYMNGSPTDQKKRLASLEKQFQKGMQLYQRWYRNLWD